MSHNNKVSIIMPSYNSSKFVGESIQSVLDQTYTDWELLITDDCSKDNSVEVINGYVAKDNRIKLFPLEKNVGAASARNVSISNATGKYIAFLDSDDLWLPNKLERQLKFMQENNCALSMSDYNVIAEDGSDLNKKISVPESINYSQYLRNTIIGCLTVIVDREKVGNFEMPIIKSSHDMALWLLLMKRGFKFYGLNESLAKYRLVSTSNTAKKWKAAKDVWKVYREIEHLNVVYSAFNFCGYALNAVLKRI